MRLCLAALLTLAPAVSLAAPADQLISLLEQKRCEDAFLLIQQVKPPPAATAESASQGRRIARASLPCRQRDTALGVAFTELAAKLAPEDPEVLTAHAEALVSLQQRAEAARLLDKVLESHPDDAPKARFARGKLAFDERDYETASKVLKPLKTDEEYGDEAQVMIVKSEAAMAQREQDEGEPKMLAPETAVKKADEAMKVTKKQPSGKVVAQLKGKVTSGGSKTFTAKGLKKGQPYLFTASGECTRKGATGKRSKKTRGLHEDPLRDISGIDFAVQFGSQQPRTLSMGQHKPDSSRIEFLADAEAMAIKVFDRSSTDKDVKCTAEDFVVLTP